MQKVAMSLALLLGAGGPFLAHSTVAQTAAAPAALKPVTVYAVQRVKTEPPTWGFERMSITISPGTTVRWKSVSGNTDSHTSTSRDDLWDSSVLNPGDTFSFTFSEPGKYRYYCRLHPWMTGVVNVVAGAPMPLATLEPPSR